MRAPSCRGGRRFFAALRRPVRSARTGHAGKGQNVPEKHRAHKAAQACRLRRQSGAAPACRAGGQRRLSPGRAVQCAYFSTAGPDIPDISDKACFPCPGRRKDAKRNLRPLCLQMPQTKTKAGCTQIYSCVQPAFSCEIYFYEGKRLPCGALSAFKTASAKRAAGTPRAAEAHGPAWTKGQAEKALPSTRRAAARKHCPLKGNFCAQPLHICLTGTKGICGKLPCFASKIAVSGVLCGFGRAALEEECAKKFSKSDGLPGVLRVPGVKAASQNRWLLASTHLVQGGILHLAPRAKRRPRAPGVHGAASPCKNHPPGSAGGDKKPQLWTKKKLPDR